MRISQHGAHLTQVERTRRTECHRVREPDELTLVDTTVAGSAGTLAGIAAVIGRPIARTVVTPARRDHVGSLDALSGAVPGAEVAPGRGRVVEAPLDLIDPASTRPRRAPS